MKKLNLLLCVTVIVSLLSCNKNDYIESPTCYKYIELSEKFDSELKYTHTDTLWPSGIHGVLSYACDNELQKLLKYVPDTVGCLTGGYESIHYKFLNR
jgi:hypothetical protein